jgi:uncharacterized membrane protein
VLEAAVVEAEAEVVVVAAEVVVETKEVVVEVTVGVQLAVLLVLRLPVLILLMPVRTTGVKVPVDRCLMLIGRLRTRRCLSRMRMIRKRIREKLAAVVRRVDPLRGPKRLGRLDGAVAKSQYNRLRWKLD